MESYTVGIDIGGTKIKFMVMNQLHQIIYEKSIETLAKQGYQTIIQRIISEVATIFHSYGKDQCIGIGIGVPGPVDVIGGYVESPPNLPGWHHVPIVNDLNQALEKPCYFENDANLAALGEYQFGLNSKPNTMLYITVSTGIGAGIIHRGTIFQGGFGNAGELGHIIINPNGRLCHCGKHGCLEAYASGTAISEIAEERLGVRLSAKEVAEKASQGDHVCERILNDAFDYLGLAISNSVYLYDPDYIVIGGGLSLLGDKILDPIKEHINKNVRMGFNKPNISTAVKGHSVGAIGAAFYPYSKTNEHFAL